MPLVFKVPVGLLCSSVTKGNIVINLVLENQGDRNFYTRFYVPEKMCIDEGISFAG